ncbi:XVIPCD domain-containing protein [Lysobacter enzymogenes]|uniref:XVIPCD domain-containing protein n=1 Tax=Lysobacter enzymogenes TaxID=69 RepID=UPI001A95EE55|nr:XVIPCD domain-containing protein [Lysobacter enzymogenes]QQP95608.1 hypothetical protein JHW38_20625 [Lysobacter enzymogenes]
MSAEPIGTELRARLDEFARQTGVTAEAARNLEAAIVRSPALTRQLNAAADSHELRRFELKSDPHAGGSFDSRNRTMALGLDDLTNKYDANNMTFVLGHEVQHGRIAPGQTQTPMDQARQAFTDQARTLAASDAPVHNYTPALTTVLQAHRDNEARAHIQGWNAMVGALRETDSNLTLEDIYKSSPRAADFIEQTGSDSNPSYRLKRNLTLEADQSISPDNAANVRAMGEYYFGKSASDARLGYRGGSDYSNLYGARYIGELAQLELDRGHAPANAPRVEIDMRALGLSERTLERNGINLGRHAGERLPYYDVGGRRPELSNFDHTIDSHDYVRNNRPTAAAPAVASVAAPAGAPALPASDLRSPQHPDHALYQSIHDKLGAQGHPLHRNAQESERLAAALTVEARRGGIERADHVVIGADVGSGRSVFVVQGGLDDPAHRRAGVAMQDALRTPVEESSRQLSALPREAPTPAPAQNETQTQAQPQPAHR